jgi:4-diphosphocytidyl-2C-methyl-D-erythritol kinase
MNESTSDIKSDMLRDIQLILDEGKGDILGEIEDAIDTIRSFERTSSIVIERIEKADNIASIIAAFEHSVFEQFPEISDLKTNLKEAGAYYTAMSGSGSSVFALFDQQPILPERIQKYVVFQGEWTL